MKRLVVAAAAVLLVAGCAPDSGKVVGRRFTPAHSSIYIACYSYDAKTGACTMQIPQTTYHGDEWELDLDNGSDEGWVDVSEGDYQRYAVGSQYPDGAR